jgi:ABC-type uncharacterized transport system permease subunit
MIELLASALPLAIVASTPLLLAVLGELVLQRSGVINLGIEGMMLVAALSAVLATHATGSIAAGFAGGIAGAAVVAALFGVFTIAVRADQIVTGTAINLFALGATGFAYRELLQKWPSLQSLPKFDAAFVLPTAWIAIPIVLGFTLWSTTFGLRLRASGENPEAVTAAHASVAWHRAGALAIEATLVGLAGAYLALVLSSGFAENMTAGRGFIALSIVIFGRWSVKGALAGTAIFGLAAASQYALQASDYGVPFHLLLALPYAITLLILCGVAGRVRAPESLGR